MTHIKDTDHLYRLVIKPSTGWAPLNLKELWDYRDLLYFLIWRDLKGRYRQTALGPIWIVLQPLFSMLLYTLIFGVIAKLPSQGEPYAVFAYTAILPWGFFATSFNSGVNGILSGLSLSSKVYFPRLILPIATIISSLVDFGISFLILLGMLKYFGITPTWGIGLLPVFLLVGTITGFGAGLWFSGLIVKFRDVGPVTSFIVRLWMYATPVVYSIEVIPEQWHALYRLNPMTNVVEGFRWALLGTNPAPNWGSLALSAILAILAFIGGVFIFRRAERIIVDMA